MGLLSWLLGRDIREEQRAALEVRDASGSMQDWIDQWFEAQQLGYVQMTQPALNEEKVSGTFANFVKGNGPIWSLALARMQVFSQTRFQWTRFDSGERSELFGTPELQVLERPWTGGTTADLLARMELDITTAGNCYIRRLRSVKRGEDRLVRMRPDWVFVILGSDEDEEVPADAADVDLLGYAYMPRGDEGKLILLEPDEVAHYAPYPDPDAVHLGMSWITPVVREILGDQLQTDHKRSFLRNAAPQPLDAKVLTASGWSTMGAMRVGSRVIGSDGVPHLVTGVYPQGEQEIYRVTFSDGGSTECTLDHLWTVASSYDRKRGVRRTLPLRALIDGDGRFGDGAGRGGLRMPSGGPKWAIPMADPVEFDPQPDVPVDPYLLGLLLGDGSFRGNRRGDGEYGSVTLASAAEDADEIAERIAPVLPDGVSLSRRDRGNWSEFYFKGPGGPVTSPLKQAIRDLGLWGKGSREKFIPGAYLTASLKDRLALLQGLIDSDGSVDARQPNLVRYTTNSPQLAADVAELTRGLGGLASMAQHGGRDRWTVAVKRLPDGMVPARLLRKAARYEPSPASRWRFIVDAEKVGVKPAQCIRVDVEDHLYVTDDFILTHNTPNLIMKFDPTVTSEQIRTFKELFEENHKGAWNAYKTAYIGGGADPVIVGANFQQLDFAVVQGKAESRLASAAGVPPSWVGFSEGLQGSALNAGNFTSARRRFSDGTLQHLWAAAATSLEAIVSPPTGAALWFVTRDLPFLAMDASDAATVQSQEATTITALVRDGFTPESAIDAVTNQNWSLLQHTGLVSVQLLPPGSEKPTGAPASSSDSQPANEPADDPAPTGGA